MLYITKIQEPLYRHQRAYYSMPWFELFTHNKASRFERQIAPYLNLLYRYAYRLTVNQYDAEDLVQELLLSLFDKGISLDKLDNPKIWLLKSLYHKFIDMTRKQARNPSKPGSICADETLAQIPDQHERLQHAIEQQDVQYKLQTALDTLNPKHKAVVTLHDIEGHSLAELVEILDTPIGTIKSRLHRARAELKKSLHREPCIRRQRVHV